MYNPKPDRGCLYTITIVSLIVGIIAGGIVIWQFMVQVVSRLPASSSVGSSLTSFTGDPNQDSQILGVSPSDLFQRAAFGDGWQVDNVTFKVYYHTCVDLAAGLSDQVVQSRINAPIEWISHNILGVTRVFIGGQGTAQGPATIYSESSNCPNQ
jgi:hypothetical protein